MSVRIGTSGWAYPEWKPAFYPAGLPQDRFLAHYATRLTACEVNGTFHRVPTTATVERWAAATPEDFRFALKAPRGVTHTAGGEWDDGARRLLDRLIAAIAPLGARAAAILLRFPDDRPYDEKMLAAMLEHWPCATPAVFDFRHPSWFTPEVVHDVAAAGGTVCATDTAGRVVDALPPGPLAYVRLRAERYTESARDGWRDRLEREGRVRPVLAFARHEGIPAGDPLAGVGLADWLCHALREGAGR